MRGRVAAFGVFAALLGSLMLSEAHVQDPNGFQDDFNYPNGTPLTLAPTAASWQLSPNVPSGWVIETRPTTLNTSTLGTMAVLVGKQRHGGLNEPIAFVKQSWSNFVFSTQAAYDRIVPPTSGVGMVFRAGVDPNTGAIDRNNLYLFTTINIFLPRSFPTGHAFMLWKRVAGSWFQAAPPIHSYVDFSNSRLHTYKVAMTGSRIQAWVDGLQVLNVEDTPGSDAQPGGYQMPGPAYATGAVGLRTSGTAALFDDVVIAGAPAYEARAAAVNMYGQAGLDSSHRSGNAQIGDVPLGLEETLAGGDGGWQYHGHDFLAETGGAVASGPLGTALLHTDGTDGTTTSSAQLAGLAGVFTDPNGRTTVTITADLIRARATASCIGTSSTVDVVNLNWEVVSRDQNDEPYVNQGNVTRLGAGPNTNLLQPSNTVGPLPSAGPVDPNGAFSSSPVRITLHSRRSTNAHQRVDVAAIRITFFQRTSGNLPPPNESTPGIVVADVALGNVVAGRLCEPAA